MGSETRELLLQGLLVTVIGMSLVFAALALLAAIVALLNRGGGTADGAASLASQPAQETDSYPELAAERARVAAIAAAALMSSAVPLQMEPPVGPAFEHGRTAPSWVTANRAIALEPWSPPRVESE
jgi:Na+-transporting methylmalonyl-CoA/oxaloacetate decarboxylase gamma subunit